MGRNPCPERPMSGLGSQTRHVAFGGPSFGGWPARLPPPYGTGLIGFAFLIPASSAGARLFTGLPGTVFLRPRTARTQRPTGSDGPREEEPPLPHAPEPLLLFSSCRVCPAVTAGQVRLNRMGQSYASRKDAKIAKRNDRLTRSSSRSLRLGARTDLWLRPSAARPRRVIGAIRCFYVPSWGPTSHRRGSALVVLHIFGVPGSFCTWAVLEDAVPKPLRFIPLRQ
jgi:hypothetical protein